MEKSRKRHCYLSLNPCQQTDHPWTNHPMHPPTTKEDGQKETVVHQPEWRGGSLYSHQSEVERWKPFHHQAPLPNTHTIWMTYQTMHPPTTKENGQKETVVHQPEWRGGSLDSHQSEVERWKLFTNKSTTTKHPYHIKLPTKPTHKLPHPNPPRPSINFHWTKWMEGRGNKGWFRKCKDGPEGWLRNHNFVSTQAE